MVIGPDELRNEKNLNEKEAIKKEILDETEGVIDEILLERSRDSPDYSLEKIEIHVEELPFPWPYRMNPAIRETIKKRFEAKKWTVISNKEIDIITFLEKNDPEL